MQISSRFRSFLPPLILASAALAACQQEQEPQSGNAAADANQAAPIIPRPQPPLDRVGLLAAVAQAASATAAGDELPAGVASLDGRPFEVRIRFGCRGPAKELEQAWLGWAYEPEKRTLRIRAKPTISSDEPLVAEIAGEAFESVEGFWIPRPWLLNPTCPANAAVTQQQQQQRADAKAAEPGQDTKPTATASAQQAEKPASEDPEPRGEPVPTAPRIGIAQFFTSDDARTRRRDSRPYSTVKTLPEATPLPSEGFNLVLSGRLRALPGRGVVECVAKRADAPPECIVSAEFLRVWIERPGSAEVIAEWGGG